MKLESQFEFESSEIQNAVRQCIGFDILTRQVQTGFQITLARNVNSNYLKSMGLSGFEHPKPNAGVSLPAV